MHTTLESAFFPIVYTFPLIFSLRMHARPARASTADADSSIPAAHTPKKAAVRFAALKISPIIRRSFPGQRQAESKNRP